MRYLILSLVIIIMMMQSCEKAEPTIPEMANYLDFENSYTNLLAVNKNVEFFSYPSNKVTDTIYVKVLVRGGVIKEKAEIILIQDEPANETINKALPGVHYMPFDAPELKRNFYFIKAGQFEKEIPIIVLRDNSLKDKNYQLDFHIADGAILRSGSIDNNKARITMSDQLERPTEWSFYGFFLGNYGKVKHQFMIDQSGKPWDNAFIVPVTRDEGLKLYYKNKFNDDLLRVNTERAQSGLDPLREDPNDPNTAITFPN